MITIANRQDVREGGSWSPVQRFKNDAIHVLVRVALFAAGRFSKASLASVGMWLGAIVHAFAWRLRGRARRNLALAFPGARACEHAAVARASFVNLGGHLGEVVASLQSPLDLIAFDEASIALLGEALGEGKGVVLPSAHLGPWERLAATIAARFPFAAIVRESYDPRLESLVATMRARAGFATIPRGAAGAATRIVRTLRSGCVLGIPMDLRTRATSVMVPFLGADSPTAVGPAQIALRTRAPVIVSTVEIIEGALTVTCTRIDAEGLAEGDEIELTKRVNAELGRRICLAREHWPWMHARR